MVYFFITLLSLICIYIWQNNKKLIEKVDLKIQQTYIDPFQKKYDDAINNKGKNDQKAIDLLSSLLIDLKQIKLMDRLAPIKENCFVQLSHFIFRKYRKTG